MTRSRFLVILIAGLAVGCQQHEPRGRVQGQVYYKGSPVPEGVVIFQNRTLGVHIIAELRQDGTFDVAMAHGMGLPYGHYQVSVRPKIPDPGPGVPSDPNEIVLPENIPEKYWHAESSELTLQVAPGVNRLTIEME
jgi:hypothetical protein